MLVWRSCLRGRLWAVLMVILSLSRSAWASADVWTDLVEQQRAQFRANPSRPEAIAAIAALVENREFFAPGRMAQVLREIVDGKLGGSADPLVASQASYLLSLEEDRQGDFSSAESRRAALGLVRDFWVVGPFDAQGRNGLLRSFPIEEEGKPLNPQSGKRYPGKEREVFWRRPPADVLVQGALFLDGILRPDIDAVAYLLTYVNSDRDQWAALRIGSPGPVKVWLGGNEVWANDVVRLAWPDQDTAPVHLRRGANPLLIKTVITRGSWRMFVRMTDLDGRHWQESRPARRCQRRQYTPRHRQPDTRRRAILASCYATALNTQELQPQRKLGSTRRSTCGWSYRRTANCEPSRRRRTRPFRRLIRT